MTYKMNKRGRPRKGRKIRTIAINRDLYEVVEQQRLIFQAAEGQSISMVDWISRLIRLGLTQIPGGLSARN